MSESVTPSLSRGSLLSSLAALGAAAALPLGVAAQSPSRRLIDVHHHYFPPQLLAAMNAWQAKHGLPPVGGPVRAWSPARTLEEMDRTGIRTAILSLASAHDVWFDVPAAQIPALSRACNEYAAGMVRDHPGRFGLFASLPLPDVAASLRETAYAFDTLKADGIGIPTSFGDVWPGDARFAPLWQELDRRGAMVVFHPYAPTCCTGISPGYNESLIEYPYDTGRAVLSLLFSGTLRKYRNVRWTFCHAGGPLPALSGRIDYLANHLQRNVPQVAPDGILAELRRLYFDTANAAYPAAMNALLDVVPVSQVMFGTDYPYVSGTENRQGLEGLKLPPATVAAIEYGNAERLLPRLRA